MELRTLDISQWRQQPGWLSQNPQLFHSSLRDNLLLARPSASDAELESALKRAQAWEFVNEKGLDYRVGDQAGGLSVGQAQRIALARTLLKTTQMMVLDEPTASLDRHSERAVMSALEQAAQGQTLLMITHRLDQLSQMDNIPGWRTASWWSRDVLPHSARPRAPSPASCRNPRFRRLSR